MDQRHLNQFDSARHNELLAQSRSYNGYTRESAIIELENYPSDKTIDALIERVNDWVPEIRRVAQYRLAQICTQKTIPHFINRLNKIYHLKACRREDHSMFVDKIEQLLIKYCDNATTHLNACDNSSAVLYAKLLKKSGAIKLPTLATVCLQHPKTSVRQYAIVLSSTLVAAERKAFLSHCIKDKSGIVRRDALPLLLRINPELSYKISAELLLPQH